MSYAWHTLPEINENEWGHLTAATAPVQGVMGSPGCSVLHSSYFSRLQERDFKRDEGDGR